MSDIVVITPSDLDDDTLKVVGTKVVATSATDTQKGVVTLAVEANFPSTSDVEAVTPAYVNASIASIPSVPNATDTVKGKVELAIGSSYPDATNDTDAATPAYVKGAVDEVMAVIDALSLDIFE